MKARRRIIPVGNICPVTPCKLSRRVAIDGMLKLPSRFRYVMRHQAATSFALSAFFTRLPSMNFLPSYTSRRSSDPFKDRQAFWPIVKSFQIIAEEGCRQRCVDEAGGDGGDSDGRERLRDPGV